MKYRWQDAKGPEGGVDQDVARAMHKILRFKTKAIPLLVACLTDESKTQHSIWDYWPEPQVRDLAFSILCDLFSDPTGNQTLQGAIMWSDVNAESPGQPEWIALGSYIKRHGQHQLQETWLKAWDENKSRIYWDDSANCFRVRRTQ
jgi:hypothetical protein